MAPNRSLEVLMDQVRLAPFGPGQYNGIYTEGLNACTVVTIVSPSAAILAHISPRPNLTQTGAHVGVDNCTSKMNQVIALYQQNVHLFPPGRTTWVISAMYEGQPALPEHRRIIEQKLQQAGLAYTNAMYLVLEAHEARGVEKGTVCVDASNAGEPYVFVEGRRVH